MKGFAVHQAIHVRFPDELVILKFAGEGSMLPEDDGHAASEQNADDVSLLRTHRGQAKIILHRGFEELAVPDDALHSPQEGGHDG